MAEHSPTTLLTFDVNTIQDGRHSWSNLLNTENGFNTAKLAGIGPKLSLVVAESDPSEL